jgi:hypothetical protein
MRIEGFTDILANPGRVIELLEEATHTLQRIQKYNLSTDSIKLHEELISEQKSLVITAKRLVVLKDRFQQELAAGLLDLQRGRFDPNALPSFSSC